MTTCVACGAGDQPEGAKFCNECGTALRTACPSCGSVVSPAAKFCNECGSPLRSAPVAGDGQTGHPVASRRITSVLFGDLVGFTSLSESRDQEDVRELLSRYFEECSRIVARYGGTVEKFIGDAVMAVWGVPTAHEDDAERSVRAGLELVTAAAAMGAELDVLDLAMRVGIVTGEVAVTVGAQHQGMVAGDAVNTASRVQSVAAPGQVWVDETTRLLTSAAISYADVGSHALKGKADPVPLWAARAVVAQIGGAARADGLEAPLVGRDRELRVIKEVYHRVEETGRPALLVVAGDAGVGKSRLGWEFSKYTDGLSDTCRWHAGKCVSYGEGVAFYALAEAVRSRLEAALDPDEDEQVDTQVLIERGLAAYVESEAEREWLAPRLGALLGTSGTPSHEREDLFAAWTTFFERVGGGEMPVVMLIDDAQYADDGMAMFVEHLMSVASYPCFVMLLARPDLLERHPSLATNRRATVLHLEQLTSGDMATLVDGLVEGLPRRGRDELVERAEGIPTFAVETVRALIDRDLVVPRGGAYVLRDPEGLDLAAIGAPASLQALISARLDTLPAMQRRVVDRASVAGDSVEPTLLRALCSDVPDLDAALSALLRAQIFRVEGNRLSSEQGRYQFVQSAVRQVAYGTLSRRERKQAHLEVLAVLTADWSEELAPVAAQHCMSAIEAAADDPDVPELTERAVGLLRQAATRARSLGSPKEASAHLATALGLTTDPGVRSGLQLAMAEACSESGRYDEALELARAARDGFVAAGLDHQEALAAAVIAEALVKGPADYEAAVREIEPYYERLADTPEDAPTLSRVLPAYALALGRVRRSSLDLWLRQLTIAEWLGDQSQIARALAALSVEMLGRGSVVLTEMALEKAVTVARQCHDLVVEGHALANWSSLLNGEDVTRAMSVSKQAVDVTTRCGNAEWMSLAMVNHTMARWATGEWDEVVAAREVETIHADDASMYDALAALVLVARGEDPAAVTSDSTRRELTTYWWLLGQALTEAFAGDPRAVATAHTVVDDAFRENGVQDDFPAIFAVAVDVAVRFGDRGLVEHLCRIVDDAGSLPPTGLRGHRALLGALTGDADEVDAGETEQLFATALREYDAWGSPVYVARARAAYGVWLAGLGRSDEAEPLVEQARATYARLGATAWLAELDEGLTADRVASATSVRSLTDAGRAERP